ncbi:hypothetical protein BSIN_3790 [Burkholderia singularis]|uniref:Uncharacterized protein n=1 Tax=Burkholderia singularis TaxID=1503053 RepID=A0A238H6G8_9BURK|nr:hypothetical protein BSIN_3790 [Burkholderia singularis]
MLSDRLIVTHARSVVGISIGLLFGFFVNRSTKAVANGEKDPLNTSRSPYPPPTPLADNC